MCYTKCTKQDMEFSMQNTGKQVGLKTIYRAKNNSLTLF